ncbi:STM4504/CBY_0614 family protein [Serratia fonticola]|uniref:STM4504/CBY_0614 family protein n=1 Tax=Serratia fonticola TaxID=47917 RepID=UPI003AAF3602
MAIFNLYSKRQQVLNGEINEVYSYDEIPKKLRVQIIHMMNEVIGGCTTFSLMRLPSYKSKRSDVNYRFICEALRKEYGVFGLVRDAPSYFAEIRDLFLSTDDVMKCLDIIELTFIVINENLREHYSNNPKRVDDAINELNLRFKENAVGYQFENGVLMRIDSHYIHSEIVKPTLRLLSSNAEYSGATNEFISAHEHYRHEKYKECLVDCLKSFESLMKSIHDKRGWEYDPKRTTARDLVNSCLKNELIPEYLQNQFSSLRGMLDSGVATIRNKEAGHGQGSEVKTVEKPLVSYMLHLTATNLLFLAQCDKEH